MHHERKKELLTKILNLHFNYFVSFFIISLKHLSMSRSVLGEGNRKGSNLNIKYIHNILASFSNKLLTTQEPEKMLARVAKRQWTIFSSYINMHLQTLLSNFFQFIKSGRFFWYIHIKSSTDNSQYLSVFRNVWQE